MSVHEESKIISKPWGREQILVLGDRYVIKILTISAGQGTSVQYHTYKDESVSLLSGEGVVLIYEDINAEPERIELSHNNWIRLVPGRIHRMESDSGCEILEVSTPELDDVTRLVDPYSR
tara:strand:+ start:515 stop:874 length:360 start_codon:yes stop_codon:yes gene_type:complete